MSLLEQQNALNKPGAEERRTGGSHESAQAVRPPTRSVDITVHRPAGRGSSIAGCTGSLSTSAHYPLPLELFRQVKLDSILVVNRIDAPDSNI